MPNIMLHDDEARMALGRGVAKLAKAVGARCFTDPFVPDAKTAPQSSLITLVTGWLADRTTDKQATSPRLESTR